MSSLDPLLCLMRWVVALVLAALLLAPPMALATNPAQGSSAQSRDHLKRAKIFLAAGDYRRALEAWNLAARGVEDLVDPPDVLARIAKEIIQGAVQKQSDVTAAMAAKLDEKTVTRLWQQQIAWRSARPDSWWASVPDTWVW